MKFIKNIIKKWIFHLNNFLFLTNFKSGSYTDKKNNKLVCYRIFDSNYELIEPSKFNVKAENLTKNLIQKPAFVNFLSHTFDLRKPGVYRFYRLNDISEQRLVGAKDFEILKQCIGNLWSYGFEGMVPTREIEETNINKRVIIASCSDLSFIASKILKVFNINSRIIACYTLDPWGGQDDGHTLLEVQSKDKKWFVYDPSFGVCVKGKSGYLNALEFHNYVQKKKKFSLVKLPGTPNNSTYRHSDYDYCFWIDSRYNSYKLLHRWYQKIFQVPLFNSDRGFIFNSTLIKKSDFQRLLSRGFIPMKLLKIKKRFYD